MRWISAFALACAACAAAPKMKLPEAPPLASAERSSDFDTYRMRRVGLLPFRTAGAESLTPQRARELQQVFMTELGRVTGYEIVLLDVQDLDGVQKSDPLRRGWYDPRTVIELGQRYTLDGLFAGTLTQSRVYVPQVLALQLELVAIETGRTIWSASLALDAGSEQVQKSIAVWCNNQRDSLVTDETPELVLLSPQRFARYAAWEVARVF